MSPKQKKNVSKSIYKHISVKLCYIKDIQKSKSYQKEESVRAEQEQTFSNNSGQKTRDCSLQRAEQK